MAFYLRRDYGPWLEPLLHTPMLVQGVFCGTTCRMPSPKVGPTTSSEPETLLQGCSVQRGIWNASSRVTRSPQEGNVRLLSGCKLPRSEAAMVLLQNTATASESCTASSSRAQCLLMATVKPFQKATLRSPCAYCSLKVTSTRATSWAPLRRRL